MRYFIIVGEPSGDTHAAGLMKALIDRDSLSLFAFFGGDQMTKVGGQPFVHLRDMAFMGFTQLLGHLGQIRKNFKIARREIEKFNPDVLILVDYPGFNLRMAKWAKRRGFRVVYFIPPKVWAWNVQRVKVLRANTDRVFSILPFEPGFYSQYGVKADYVGNPVAEQVLDWQRLHPVNNMEDSNRIALLPGSRAQEIDRVLPEMIAVAKELISFRFVIAGMEQHRELYEKWVAKSDQFHIDYTGTFEVLSGSMAALVTSGTATLETALMNIPQVVCYKTNPLSYGIAKRLIKVKYISLVNLILNQPAVPELIQEQCTGKLLARSLARILPGGSDRSRQIELYAQLKSDLGNDGVLERVSDMIIKYLKDS